MTASTQIAVFYATDSKILRRKVIPDDEEQLEILGIAPGESMLLLRISHPYDDASCRAAITAATGIAPPSGRCCIVGESGDVIGVCNSDPALDSHPQGALIASERAGPGDRYMGGAFLRRYRVVSTSSNAVGSTVWLPIVDRAN
jgi:hypothetical protein